MKEFKSNKIEPIKIYGKEYIIDSTNLDFMEKVEEAEPKLNATIASLKGKSDIKSLREMVKVFIDFMDVVLGAGAGAEIWESSNHSVHKMLDCLLFLTESISESKQATTSKYLTK